MGQTQGLHLCRKRSLLLSSNKNMKRSSKLKAPAVSAGDAGSDPALFSKHVGIVLMEDSLGLISERRRLESCPLRHISFVV